MVAEFKKHSIQIVGGVPFKVGEPEGLATFRMGLFGLDKLNNVDASVTKIKSAL